MLPDDNQAYQFAVMLEHGLPASQAILYFVESDDTAELAILAKKWSLCRRVRLAAAKLLPIGWEEMTDDEKMKSSLSFHYRQLATLLRSNHYAEADAGMKGKLDSARTALESKLAGTSGKVDALASFFDDLRSGRIKVAQPTLARTLN